MASPYSASNIALNNGFTNATFNQSIPQPSNTSTKQATVYPNSLFRLLAPRKLITISTCYECADRVYKSQKTGGIIHDPLTDEVLLSIKLCKDCVAANQSTGFSQLKITKKTDENIKV
uniref:Uncharacterized protein n=1 Tax=Panagrolaimus davidi TaxID=227884 RepID=A0A914Q550_9BILA